MMTPDDTSVWVRRQWNDYRSARYRLEDIENVHWDIFSGGVMRPAPQPFLHGYVWCNALLEGDLAHSCLHGRGPHRIKVCIVKKENRPAVYAALAAQAGPKPEGTRRTSSREGKLTRD